MVKNPLCNAEDLGSIPGWGTKVSHSIEKLSLHAVTTKPVHSGGCMPQLESLYATMKDPMLTIKYVNTEKTKKTPKVVLGLPWWSSG